MHLLRKLASYIPLGTISGTLADLGSTCTERQNEQQTMTTPAILNAALQSAWGSPPVTKTGIAERLRPVLTKDTLTWERVGRRTPGEPDSDWPAEFGDFVIKVYRRESPKHEWEWIGRRPCCQNPACGCRKKNPVCLHNFGQTYAIGSSADERMNLLWNPK